MFCHRYFWVAIALLAAAGCRNNRSELVEAELRTRDRELREARGELLQSQSMNEALENTVRAQQFNQPLQRPAAAGLNQIKDIQLARGTGRTDVDKNGSEDALQIVVVPRDMDASPVKAAGTLRVTAIEVSPAGLKSPLSAWDVSALQLRRSWRSGLFSTGYFVTLPWQKLPSTEKLRIVATFTSLDGGTFEAEKDVTVNAASGTMAGPPYMTGPAILGPPLPGGGPAGPILPSPPVGPPPRTAPPTEKQAPPANPTSESKRWYPVRREIEIGRPDGVEPW